jgi:hypothetical protein
MDEAELKQSEENRRERHWDPLVRWHVLQQTITWADAQATAGRNTKRARLVEQQVKLARLGLYPSND